VKPKKKEKEVQLKEEKPSNSMSIILPVDQDDIDEPMMDAALAEIIG